MQSDQDSTPATPTRSPSALTKTPRTFNLSDDDSDSDLDNGDHSYLANLNVPERLKNILRYKDIGNTQQGGQDVSDSDDDDDLFMRPSILKTPDRPSPSTPTITANSTVRLPPIAKESPQVDQKNRFEQLLALALGDSSSDDDNDDKLKKKKGPAKKTKKKTTATKKKKGSTTATKKKKKPEDKAKADQDISDTLSTTDSDSDGSTQRRTKKKKNPTGLAILEDSEDDSDDTKRPKQLSRKARLEMERETQKLRRAAHVKLQPRMVRRTVDNLMEKLELEQKDESPISSVILDDMQPQQDNHTHQSPTRINIYDKYKKELEKLERFNNKTHAEDDDDGLIIVSTETRSTKFMKTLLSAKSPEPPSPLRGNNNRRSMGKSPSSPLALRTLNQQLMAKMGQDQQAYRQEGVEKAKALGLYISPEERAKRYLEREQEAAVLDLEVQQLLYRKAMQQNQKSINNDDDDDDDDDYTPGDNKDDDRLILSGDDDEEANDDHSDDSDDGPVIIKRRNRLSRRQKNPFLLDEDEEAELKARQQKPAKAPEPAHSIAKFFLGNKTKPDDDDNNDSASGPKVLTRLMQRTLIEDEPDTTMDNDDDDDDDDDDNNDDANDDDDQQETEDVQPSTPKPSKPKERNDYVEEEAEEEEDEFFGLGGPDIAESADLDHFEEDGMLIHDKDNKETVDSAQLQAEHHKNMLESDQHMVERLIKDITGGGLRRKRAAAAAGLLLDDYDLYDDDERQDDDLVALRLALANKRKKMMKGDPMSHLASDPKTAAFAMAAMPVPGALDLSADEMDEQEDDEDVAQVTSPTNINNDRTVNLDDDDDDYSDDDDDNIKININRVVGDYIETWTSRSDNPTKV